MSFLPDSYDDDDDPKPRTWVLHVTRTLTGVMTLDAKGYGITTEKEARSYAEGMLQESDTTVDWEGGGDKIDSCYAQGSKCQPRRGGGWCEAHDAGFIKGKNCWVREDDVHARWRARQDERSRKAWIEFARTHHHTEWAPEKGDTFAVHRWKCKDCEATGTDREARKEHGNVPLAEEIK